jgi:hypothetical protein
MLKNKIKIETWNVNKKIYNSKEDVTSNCKLFFFGIFSDVKLLLISSTPNTTIN